VCMRPIPDLAESETAKSQPTAAVASSMNQEPKRRLNSVPSTHLRPRHNRKRARKQEGQ